MPHLYILWLSTLWMPDKTQELEPYEKHSRLELRCVSRSSGSRTDLLSRKFLGEFKTKLFSSPLLGHEWITTTMQRLREDTVKLKYLFIISVAVLHKVLAGIDHFVCGRETRRKVFIHVLRAINFFIVLSLINVHFSWVCAVSWKQQK